MDREHAGRMAAVQALILASLPVGAEEHAPDSLARRFAAHDHAFEDAGHVLAATVDDPFSIEAFHVHNTRALLELAQRRGCR